MLQLGAYVLDDSCIANLRRGAGRLFLKELVVLHRFKLWSDLRLAEALKLRLYLVVSKHTLPLNRGNSSPRFLDNDLCFGFGGFYLSSEVGIGLDDFLNFSLFLLLLQPEFFLHFLSLSLDPELFFQLFLFELSLFLFFPSFLFLHLLLENILKLLLLALLPHLFLLLKGPKGDTRIAPTSLDRRLLLLKHWVVSLVACVGLIVLHVHIPYLLLRRGESVTHFLVVLLLLRWRLIVVRLLIVLLGRLILLDRGIVRLSPIHYDVTLAISEWGTSAPFAEGVVLCLLLQLFTLPA